ncbi:MAG: hypothetical protein L3J18_02825 [Candidatus Brocadia sp.]|uniref:Uncharacterized protein n=1 Tax=Candidatus Brocadia fulgida TaxID=380242 RepID=A0A0M2UZL9_9BACT|nr:MAG: hypothetical protein BROFUL_01331 [Candidatus Brocadia fulgida]UJS21261.1 MAG: hypothetical protein L3J18_02825 [Candidatus Brocadia sp.]
MKFDLRMLIIVGLNPPLNPLPGEDFFLLPLRLLRELSRTRRSGMCKTGTEISGKAAHMPAFMTGEKRK